MLWEPSTLLTHWRYTPFNHWTIYSAMSHDKFLVMPHCLDPLTWWETCCSFLTCVLVCLQDGHIGIVVMAMTLIWGYEKRLPSLVKMLSKDSTAFGLSTSSDWLLHLTFRLINPWFHQTFFDLRHANEVAGYTIPL